jgi:hypothetical protein
MLLASFLASLPSLPVGGWLLLAQVARLYYYGGPEVRSALTSEITVLRRAACAECPRRGACVCYPLPAPLQAVLLAPVEQDGIAVTPLPSRVIRLGEERGGE